MRLFGANWWCFFLMIKHVGVLWEILLLDFSKEYLDLVFVQTAQNIILSIWNIFLIRRFCGWLNGTAKKLLMVTNFLEVNQIFELLIKSDYERIFKAVSDGVSWQDILKSQLLNLVDWLLDVLPHKFDDRLIGLRRLFMMLILLTVNNGHRHLNWGMWTWLDEEIPLARISPKWLHLTQQGVFGVFGFDQTFLKKFREKKMFVLIWSIWNLPLIFEKFRLILYTINILRCSDKWCWQTWFWHLGVGEVDHVYDLDCQGISMTNITSCTCFLL